jgi:electron transport complex protein RnfG
MASGEASPLRMMFTLGLAGFCSGLAVVGAYLLTQPRIERNRSEALEAAIFRVLDGARSRRAFVLRDREIVALEPGAPAGADVVYAGYDAQDALVGFAIPAEGAGFQDTIKLIYGMQPGSGRMVGMEVLESRETPGLGDKIQKDTHFLSRFRDLNVSPTIALVKGAPGHDNEVDAISGATISSKAVVRILNDANARWLEPLVRLEAGGGAAGGPSVGGGS